MQIRTDIHLSACKDKGKHTLAVPLPLCYAPAVKSQLNNESTALPSFCIEAEEPLIACIERFMCAFLPAAARTAHTGEMSLGDFEKIQARLPAHLSLDGGGDRQPSTVANLIFFNAL